MDIEKVLSEKNSPALVGFGQALGVVLYVSLIVVIINTLFSYIEHQAPEIMMAFMMITLFVFSAGITGSLVFGLPVYFAFSKNNITRAISILAYTFLYLFVVVGVTATTILIFYGR